MDVHQPYAYSWRVSSNTALLSACGEMKERGAPTMLFLREGSQSTAGLDARERSASNHRDAERGGVPEVDPGGSHECYFAAPEKSGLPERAPGWLCGARVASRSVRSSVYCKRVAAGKQWRREYTARIAARNGDTARCWRD